MEPNTETNTDSTPTKQWKNKYAQKYYETHKDKCKERVAKSYAENKDKILDRMKIYQKRKRVENKELMKLFREFQKKIENHTLPKN